MFQERMPERPPFVAINIGNGTITYRVLNRHQPITLATEPPASGRLCNIILLELALCIMGFVIYCGNFDLKYS